MSNNNTFLLILLLLCVSITASNAQILVAPSVVGAASDGSFAYNVEMLYPTSGAYFGGYTIMDLGNIAEGTTYIDGFCMSWVEGDSRATYEVRGNLSNPSINGLVGFEWFICDPNFGDTVETLVIAGPVENDSRPWSSIKSIYR